jgi:hypothetical protein
MKNRKITIIIVNWNGKKDTIECLNSLQSIEYDNFDVLVVDNGSIDDSVQEISRYFPEVTVVATGKNLGFAEGNNIGILDAIKRGAEYVFLLNNDTVVDQNILNVLYRASRCVNDGVILGAKILYYSDPTMIWYAGARWDSRRLVFNHIGMKEHDGEAYEKIADTDYICGCALFAHVNIFKRVGLLDERFFLMFEETDFCYRARRQGYRSIIVPEGKVFHKISVSFGGDNSPLYNYFLNRNLLLWAEKNLTRYERIEIGKRKLIEFVKSLFPVHPNAIKFASDSGEIQLYGFCNYLNSNRAKYADPILVAKRRGILDYFLRRFGNCPENIRILNNTYK